MPTETAPQPPVAAPAAITPPAAPAVTKVETPINTVTQKPISEAAHNLFRLLQESGDPMKEEAEVETPKPTPEPVEAAAPAVAEEPAVVKVSKKTPKRPDLPIAKEETPAPVAAPTPQPTDDKWKESLMDEEKVALDDAEFAEKVNPKHKGLAEKMGKFFRDQKKYLEEHPDADENDAAYKQILDRAPKLSAVDKREVAEARIEERVSKKYESRYTGIEQELFTRDEEPKIEAESQQIRRHMAFNALPEEMLNVLKEKGFEKGTASLMAEYADEMEIAGNLINGLTEDAKELLRITKVNPKTNRTLGEVAQDEKHPKWEQHNRIAKIVNDVCEDFKKTAPQGEQVKNGKWFVTREEWAKIPANQRSQFWTFTNSESDVRDMIRHAMGWMPSAIAQRIKANDEKMKQRGYVRNRTPAPVVPVATPPVPVASTSTPRPSPTPAPSATPAGQLTPGQMLARRLAGE